MHIKTITAGPFETNSYFVFEDSEGIMIDPTFDTQEFFSHCIRESAAKHLRIFLTHSHLDHIAEVASLQKAYHAELYVHELDAKNVEDPGSDGLPLILPIPKAKVDHFLEEKKNYHIGKSTFTVIHTPGHTPGGCCFYFSQKQVLFSGDTLFQGTIGNLSFPTAEPKKMWASLKKLAKLPQETIVYPGHGPPTTIGEETWLEEAEKIFGF